MKEFIDKLIERLEEVYKDDICDLIPNCDEFKNCKDCRKEFIKKAIKPVLEEYNNDFCEWKFTKSVADGGYFYSSGCSHKRFSDLRSFEFCPYCGKKIKVVK